MDLPISRVARDRYDFREPVALTDAAERDAARRLARRMGKHRAAGAPKPPDRRQIRAMATIHEAMHRVADQYAEERGEPLFRAALEAVGREVGPNALDEALLAYAAEFPPPSVAQGHEPPREYIDKDADDRSNRERVLEELLLLWLANRNPAFMRHGELFDDWPVARASLYAEIVEGVRRHLSGTRDPGGRDLVAMLREPAQASPESLAGQLRYIRDHWPAAADVAEEATAELEAATDTDDGDVDDDVDDDVEDGADEAEMVDFATPMAG
ncbi:MAG: hypothetical protein ABIZ34_07335, partial [Candidatus Limnocylindrales bacterium]